MTRHNLPPDLPPPRTIPLVSVARTIPLASVARIIAVFALLFGAIAAHAADATPPPASPFKDLPGRWVGEGRLGLKDGKVETVKCRATYFLSADERELKQNIRCASASGKIEVQSAVTHKDGKLSGKWNELIYNLGGDLDGAVTPRGFRISVRGSGLTANMDVMVLNAKQVVEIQFFESTLLGLSLLLQKG
jgi:hypothetical protein